MKRPLLILLVSYVLGILYAEFSVELFPLLTYLIPLLLLMNLFITHSKFHYGTMGVLFFLLGAWGHAILVNRIPADHITRMIDPAKRAILVGRVITCPELFENRTQFILSAERYNGERASGKVQVSIYSTDSNPLLPEVATELDYGDRIEIRGKFRPPFNVMNPGSFDYVAYLKRKGIRVTGSSSDKNVRIIEKAEDFSFHSSILKKRRAFVEFIHRELSGKEGAVIAALISGARGGIDASIRDSFSRTGSAHLLAISGLHIGFVSFFCYHFFHCVFRFGLPLSFIRKSYFWFIPFRLASCATLLWVPCYTIFAGGRTSTSRAAVMIGIYLLAKILERERDLIHTLTLAAWAILIWRPASLFETDFQLSFAAVTAMALYFQNDGKKEKELFPGFKEKEEKPSIKIIKKIPGKFGKLMIVSLLALAATVPITASVFHRTSLTGLFTNLLFIPLTGFWIIPWGLAALLIFLFIPQMAIGPLKMAAAGVDLLIRGVELFDTITWTSQWVFPPSFYVMALFYLCLLILLSVKRNSAFRRILGIAILSILFFVYNDWNGKIKSDGFLHIRFLDVGQGASILMILPSGETFLIDGGGSYDSSYDVGRRVLLPALLNQGIKKIDTVVLTHPHPDHLNGLVSILEEIPVGCVWDGWKTYPSESYKNFRQIISEKNILRRFLNRRGEKIQLGELCIEVLHHGTGVTHQLQRNINNESLVLKITYGHVSFLMTGDLEKEGEKYLADHHPEKLQSTILQVPHHGSFTSSSSLFLDYVRPEIAVIQAGRYNRFRLPSMKILAKYRYIYPQTIMFRTDEYGAVWLKTDGVTVTMKGSEFPVTPYAADQLSSQ